MKIINLKEFEKNIPTMYHSDVENVKEHKEHLIEVKKYYPACSLEFKIEEPNIFHSVYIRLEHTYLDLNIRYGRYEKKYIISCNFPYNNVSLATRIKVEKTFEAPNQIGVLSEKKIKDWILYYEKVDTILKVRNQANKDNIEEFIKKAESLPVRWNRDKKGGWIQKNGLELLFTVHDEYVDCNLKLVTSVRKNLENFIALSDNKYKMTNKEALQIVKTKILKAL